MIIFYYLIVLLFSVDMSCANELLLSNDYDMDRVETEKESSTTVLKNYVFSSNGEQDDILIDESLSTNQQDVESEDFTQLLPDEDLEEDEDISLQEEKDTQTFSLENQKITKKIR